MREPFGWRLPCGKSGFNGLIQHSFALRIDNDHAPFSGASIDEQVTERFSLSPTGGAAFCPRPVGETPADREEASDQLAPHSQLVEHGLTAVHPLGIKFLRRDANGDYAEELPDAFSWATDSNSRRCHDKPEAKLIFAQDHGGRTTFNDFLIEEVACGSDEPQERSISRVLLEVLAHRRSLLFGLALASRFVNVMLPHAVLKPAPEGSRRRHGRAPGSWILQPLVSLIRVKHGQGELFRRNYSLTLFLVPVENELCGAREMAADEIEEIVNAGWGLASSRSVGLPPFGVTGPLPRYLSRLARFDLGSFYEQPASQQRDTSLTTSCPPVTLRQASETIAFAVSLAVTQGSRGGADIRARRRVGKDVITALGSARVSSVLVVDSDLEQSSLDDQQPSQALPGALGPLMETLVGDARFPSPANFRQRRRYRLDRPFYKNPYAIGVLPATRCAVVVSPSCTQRGRLESGLMQASLITYMTIGAATAIGTMRAIDRDLEAMERSDPRAVAKIDGEIAVDLHEIYDLDITHETYRSLYRLLRKRLGITRDYRALEEKMQALYRETSASHEARTQTQLILLTAAIVVLSVFILVVPIIAK